MLMLLLSVACNVNEAYSIYDKEATVPWHIGTSATCPASKPHAVIKDSDDSVAGCHTTEADAKKQLAALYAQEEKDFDPNQPRDPHSGEWIGLGQVDEIIKAWTSPGGYRGIQKALRTPPSDAELTQSPHLMQMKENARRLEAVIAAKGESRQGEEAWRLTSAAHIDPAVLAQLKAGNEVEFRDPGFLSLTPDRQTAENIGAFTHADEEQMLLHVKIESNAKALEPDRGEFGQVREWVYPPGTGMRVVMTGRSSHGIPIYEVVL